MKLPTILLRANNWLLKTTNRSLERAHKAALEIQSIEEKHFQGQKVSIESGLYSESAIAYFQTQVNQYLTTIKVSLIELKASNYIVSSYELLTERLNQDGVRENQTASALEKLSFIDAVASKYRNPKQDNLTLISNKIKLKKNAIVARDLKTKVTELETVSDKTSLLPRSILKTFGRIKQEMNREEDEVINKFRRSRNKTAISIRFLLLLIILPLLTHQLSKTFIVTPVVERYFYTEETENIFLNRDIEEEALMELEKWEKKIKLETLMGLHPSGEEEDIEIQLKEKAKEVVEFARHNSQNALANVFADVFSLIAFAGVIVVSKREIVVFKSFIDEIIYGLSDSAKAFLIILFTDIFVGYHSPHGWEVILEGIARHLGIRSSREFNFIFIATFPVILDTVLKYWIFRYLNRISPSAVATYKNMNE